MSASPKSTPHGPGPDFPLMIEAVDTALKAALLDYTAVLPMSQVTMGKYALAAPGKVMPAAYDLSQGRAPEYMPRWPLFALLSCQACAPSSEEAWRVALPAAVAVEIAMAAADLIDEITDDDPSPFVEKYGTGQALNTGNLMLVMAQQILLKGAVSETHGHSLEACAALQDMLVLAAVGQHLDMLYGEMPQDAVDLEMSVEMTSLKAGALISGACKIGALMSGAETAVVEIVSRFGRELGSQAQVLNDIQDVTPRPAGIDEPGGATDYYPERKSDLRRRKRTLPIVFTLREEAPQPNLVQAAFASLGQTAQQTDASLDAGEEALRQTVAQVGGIHFANLVAEVHRQHALEALAELEAARPGAAGILAPLVPGGVSDAPL